MAYGITTAGTTLAKVYRKVQGNVLKGFQAKCEEWALAKRLKEFDLDMSAREVTTPIDIIQQGSGAFIPEGGYEANPKTAAPQELSFTWANYNDRFSFTLTSEYLDRKFRQAQLVRQAKYQTKKLIEGLTNRVGTSFYGVSTGVLAKTSTNATQASGTYALKDAYGQSGLDDTAFLASLFKVDDYVALIRTGALVANAIGIITAVHATNGLTITWAGSVDSDDGDEIVLANSAGHLITTGTIAHTDYNKAPSGLLDFLTATTVHGLSGSTYPLWMPALADTAGGRLTGTRIKKGQHQITNLGGGKMNLLIQTQGVERDVYQSTSNAVQFNDPLNMEILGNVKTKSIEQFSSRKVPTGFGIGMDKGTLHRWTMVPMPGEDAESLDGIENANEDKLQDQNAKVMSFDFPYAFVTTNRGNMAYWSALTEA